MITFSVLPDVTQCEVSDINHCILIEVPELKLLMKK